jgi:large subunit ribosomal protein L25
MVQEELIINAEKRTVKGKQVGALRRAGFLPGVIYGRHLDAFPIQMDAKDASYKINHLTSSSLVTINIDGKKYPAIVRDRQKDVIYGQLLHVDFLAVSLTEKLRTTVNVELVGEAPITEGLGVVIVQSINELEIECLPQDLPERIEVDISTMQNAEDVITVGSLDLGENIVVLTDPEEVIVSSTYEAEEVEEEPEEEIFEFGTDEPEVIEKGKKEEEASEEENE